MRALGHASAHDIPLPPALGRPTPPSRRHGYTADDMLSTAQSLHPNVMHRSGPPQLRLGRRSQVLLAGGSPGALYQYGLEPDGTFVQARRQRLPALSACPGHRPAQASRCPAVGKRSILVPISASMVIAANSPTPGIVRSGPIKEQQGARPATTSASIRWIAAPTS